MDWKMIAVGACFISAAAGGSARADMTIVQSTTVKDPQMAASLSPQMRAMIESSPGGSALSGAPVKSTIYIHGTEMRIDMNGDSTIVNPANHKIIQVDRNIHGYVVSRYGSAGKSTSVISIKPTGKSKVILGHRVYEYHVDGSVSGMQGSKIVGDIWAAPDIPQPPPQAYGSGPESFGQQEISKIKGMPLQIGVKVTGTPMGNMNMQSDTVSISQQHLSSSVFAIPTGFKNDTNAGVQP